MKKGFVIFNARGEITKLSIPKLVKTSAGSDTIYVFADFDSSSEETAYRATFRMLKANGNEIGEFLLPLSEATAEEMELFGVDYSACRKLVFTELMMSHSGPFNITITYKKVDGLGNVISKAAMNRIDGFIYEAVNNVYDEDYVDELRSEFLPRDLGDLTDGIKPDLTQKIVIRQSGETKLITLDQLNSLLEDGVTEKDLEQDGRLTTNESDIANLESGTTVIPTYELKANKNVANGYVGLDTNNKIPLGFLYDVILGQLEWGGSFNPNSGYPAQTNALDPNRNIRKGDYFIANANGTISGVEYHTGDWAVRGASDWQKIDNTDAVASVNGKIGIVNLTGADINVSGADTTTIADKITEMATIIEQLKSLYDLEESVLYNGEYGSINVDYANITETSFVIMEVETEYTTDGGVTFKNQLDTFTITTDTLTANNYNQLFSIYNKDFPSVDFHWFVLYNNAGYLDYYNGGGDGTLSSVNIKLTAYKMRPLTAENMSYDNSLSDLNAENVQEAIDELENEIDSVETTITNITNALFTTENGSLYDWVIGSLNTSNGAQITLSTTIRTDFIRIDKGVISLLDKINFRFSVFKYDLAKTFLSYRGTADISDYVVEEDCYIRVCLRREPDSEINVEDVDEIASKIEILFTSIKDNSVSSSKIVDGSIGVSKLDDYNKLVVLENYTNPLFYVGQEFTLDFSAGATAYRQITPDTNPQTGDTFYGLVKTNIIDGSLADLIFIRYGLDGNLNKYRANSTHMGNGLYFIKFNFVYDASCIYFRFMIDNRNQSSNVIVYSYSVSKNGLYPIGIVGFMNTNIINKIFYVAYDGLDSNDGLSPSTPFATFNKAIAMGADVIYAKRGKYNNIPIVANGLPKIHIKPYEDTTWDLAVPDRPLIEIQAVQDELTDLTTNGDGVLTKEVALAQTHKYYLAFVSKTLSLNNTEKSWISNRYNVNCWQIGSNQDVTHKLVPVLTYAECVATVGTFTWDGTNIFINPYATAYTKFVIPLENVDNLISIVNCGEVVLEDVATNFAFRESFQVINCMNVTMKNCHCNYSSLGNGIVLNNSNGNLYKCSANFNGQDGFNIHYYGAISLWDCDGMYNCDDGASHHEGSSGTIQGGIWKGNGKAGIAPAYASKVNCFNTIVENNLYGFYYKATSQYVIRDCFISGNLIKDNGTGIYAEYYNLRSVNDVFVSNGGDTDAGAGSTITKYPIGV